MGPKGSMFEGKTLDDAVRKGLDTLGLSRAEVMINVVEEGSGGFLGLGARPYKVIIMQRPGGPPRDDEGERDRDRDRRGGRGRRAGRTEAAPRGERNGRGGREARGRGGERSGRGGERGGRGGERGAERGSERAPRRQEERAPRSTERPQAPAAAAAAPVDAVSGEGGDASGRRRRRGRRGGRGRRGERSGERPMGAPETAVRESETPQMDPVSSAPAGETPAAPVMTAEPTMTQAPVEQAPRHEEQESFEAPVAREPRPPRERDEDDRRDSAPSEPGMDPEALAALGRQWTEDLLRVMGFEAKVTAKAEDDRVDVAVEVTERDDLLTGPKGEVRQAMQHLLNRMVNRGEGSRYHLQLEINDFWQQREDELRKIAQDLASEALEKGGEAVTEYLNSQERRIIHMTLREDSRVKTYALGTGLIKRVAIAPADFPEGDRPED